MPRLFGNANSAGGSRTARRGRATVQGKKVAITGNFRRTPDTRENGGLLSKMRGSLPKIARPTVS